MKATGAHWDVLVVGAGPAGLSAALILGRCGRRVLLCDRGTPRNWASHAMHGYLSRDGLNPQQFRKIALEEIARYSTVELRDAEVLHVERLGVQRFAVQLADGQQLSARKILLATGLVDELPPIPGVADFFGTSVFQCPYCDGWELRDLPVAVFANGRRAFAMARALTAWTRDILLCTHGPSRLSARQLSALRANDIVVNTAQIRALEGTNGKLERINFDDGTVAARVALFFDLPCHPQSDLARKLGCEVSSAGAIRCGHYEATSVRGVFVAGNILRDVQLSIVAAAEGAKAAFGINRAITREDFAARTGAIGQIDHPGPDEPIEARANPS